jgi:hypothetical protein
MSLLAVDSDLEQWRRSMIVGVKVNVSTMIPENAASY